MKIVRKGLLVPPFRNLIRWMLLTLGWASLGISFLAARMYSQTTRPQISEEILSDGVEHWHIVSPQTHESYFWQLLQELAGVTLPKKAPPFGKSIAFLAGVGTYHHLSPQLDKSVPNDLKEMRELLLKDMGFDEVYVARDDVVNRDLIEEYVKGKIPASASKEDRLLFYFSGHGGAEPHGKTGYLLFGNAEAGKFYTSQVLAVDALLDWSKELKFQHVLFLLDSCASGLAFTSKSATQDGMIETLSGNGSRTVITAGTAEEETFANESRQQQGNGVFTGALLTAFRSVRMSDTTLITVAELYARIEEEIGKFRLQSGQRTHPLIVRLEQDEYRGTFVFLNTRVAHGQLTAAESEALGATHVAREGEALKPPDTGKGVIEVFSTQDGQIFIDAQYKGDIVRGGSLTFQRQTTGIHQVQIRAPSRPGRDAELIQSKDIATESRKITPVTFGVEPPFDHSGKIPVGTLVVDATHDLGGRISIDDYDFGDLKADGRVSIPDLMAGTHKLQISQEDRIITYPVVITASQTEHIVFGPSPPAPPTGLTATVY